MFCSSNSIWLSYHYHWVDKYCLSAGWKKLPLSVSVTMPGGRRQRGRLMAARQRIMLNDTHHFTCSDQPAKKEFFFFLVRALSLSARLVRAGRWLSYVNRSISTATPSNRSNVLCLAILRSIRPYLRISLWHFFSIRVWLERINEIGGVTKI